MNTLYISYDGMTDPLGQSQVLPYLIYLSQKGYKITLLSAEKKDRFELNYRAIQKKTADYHIDWQYVQYTSKPPVISTLWDIYRMKQKAYKLHKAKHFKLIHCRSYIAALIGLSFKKKFKVPFVFDMRGFWADERVEGKIWSLKNPVFKMVYNYFKRKEKEFIDNSDHIVTLTHKGKSILNTWQMPLNAAPVSVIPCCVDTELFSSERLHAEKIKDLRVKLNISDETKVISYLGSLGTWYMADEMMDFFKLLSEQKPAFKMMFITYDKPETIMALADRFGVDRNKIIIVKAMRDEVPLLLSLTCVSLFFIKPVFSKKASSPTKQAEVLSMGIPIICNDGIGDTSEIITDNHAGFVIKAFNNEAYMEAINQIDFLIQIPKDKVRQSVIGLFSLDAGGEHYNAIYQSIKNKENEIEHDKINKNR